MYCFNFYFSLLQEFVGENQWIHIDIAGVMMNKDEVPYLGGGMAGKQSDFLLSLIWSQSDANLKKKFFFDNDLQL